MARDEFDVALHRYAHTLRAARLMPINGLFICAGIARALAGLGEDAAAVELDAGVEANFDREGLLWARESLAPAPGRELALMAAARARLSSDAVAQAKRRGRDREHDELIDLALTLADEHAPRHARTTQAT